MCAPSKAHAVQLVRIQPEQRPATTSEVNSTLSLVTGGREAKGIDYRAAKRVKALSPEITSVSVVDAVHSSGTQYSHSQFWQEYESATGSEAMAQYQKDSIRTWEAQGALPNAICGDKPMDDKLLCLREVQPC